MTPDEEALFADLEDVFAEVDEDDVVDLTTLSTSDLLERFYECEQYLKDERQLLRPDTQESRDAHSERNAIQVILHEREVL